MQRIGYHVGFSERHMSAGSTYGRSGKPPATKDFERIARKFFGALVLTDVLNEVCACDV